MANSNTLTMLRNSTEYVNYMENVIREYNSNGKKTVLLTCDNFFPVVDGVVNVVDNYAKCLAKEGFNVVVLAPDYKNQVYLSSYPVIAVKSFYSDSIQYQVATPVFDSQCKRLLKLLRIDLIHCHAPFFVGELALKLHKTREIPMISTFHSQYRQDFVKAVKNETLAEALLRTVMKVYDGSNEVWTMHTASKQTLASYGYNGYVKLMPNGTTFSEPTNYATERNNARQSLGITDKQIMFLFVGRLITQKNILFVADVLGLLKQKGLDFKMVFVGEGPDRHLLEERLQRNNVIENTIMLGKMDDQTKLAETYAGADLFLFPSLYDVSSIVQIEASSRKTPVAFVENSVTSCTVTHGVNGFVFPCNVEEYAQQVYNTVTNSKLLEQVGNNAKRDLYVNWTALVHNAVQRYNQYIKGSSPKFEG